VQYLKHCLNPTVIAGLVVVAAAIWVFAPDAFTAALPVLVVAVCPLSMAAMLLLMRDSGQDTSTGSVTAEPSLTAAPQLVGRPAGAEIAALRAQVADLQAQLAAAARRAGPAGDAADPTEQQRPTNRVPGRSGRQFVWRHRRRAGPQRAASTSVATADRPGGVPDHPDSTTPTAEPDVLTGLSVSLDSPIRSN